MNELSIDERIKQAKQFITDWHKLNYPELYKKAVKEVDYLNKVREELNKIPKINKP